MEEPQRQAEAVLHGLPAHDAAPAHRHDRARRGGAAFEKTPYAARLRSTGVVLSYICPLMYMNNPLSKAMPVITSSNKLRTYTTARYYTEDEIITMITKGAN